jgi:Tol biopolymer transport system component
MDTRVGRTPLSRIVAAIVGLLACDGGAAPTTPPAVGPAAILIVSPATLRLVVGDNGTLVARAYDRRSREVTASLGWSSADPAVASVNDGNGSVVAVSPGSTTITATAGTISATAVVVVRPLDPAVTIVISTTSVALIAGGTERLVARAVDSTGRTATVPFQWSSENPGVATVGATDGIVTAISPGVTKLTVTAGMISATATVSVLDLPGSFAFTRLTSDGSGRFSSDVLVYSRSDGSLRSLPRAAELTSVAGPAWSPDGTLLAIEAVREFFGPPAHEWVEYTSDLYVLDAARPDGSPLRALTVTGLNTAASWSPDGTRIAYLEQKGIFSTNYVSLVDAAGGSPIHLTPNAAYHSRPRWSPDGKRLAFSVSGDGTASSRIVTVNADGSGSTNISAAGAWDADPSWSPDGRRLAFVRYDDPTHGVYVFVSDATGANATRLTSEGYASTPVWSPDGRQIMFSLNGALWVMGADGSSLTRLTSPPNGAHDSAPVWRP